MSKIAYSIKNWSEYNQALVSRGDITIWVEEAVSQAWYSRAIPHKMGAPFIYSEAAILCLLTVRAIFHLPLRQTQGFMASVLKLMGSSFRVPCYSTLSRRAKSLDVELPSQDQASHIVIDSTGLKVYGEGEWKVRQYGYAKRRTWRKFHIAANAESGEIIACVLTTNDVHDSQVLPELLEEQSGIEVAYADGAYDTHESFQVINEIGAAAVIPPRAGARIEQHGNTHAPPTNRDENIRGMRKLGRRGWKEHVGYHRRSMAENVIFRLKTLFGSRLKSRGFEQQATEAFVLARTLNIMTAMGMPISVPTGT